MIFWWGLEHNVSTEERGDTWRKYNTKDTQQMVQEVYVKGTFVQKKKLSPKILNHSHFTGLSYNSIIVAHVNYSV